MSDTSNINCDEHAKLTDCIKLFWNNAQYSDIQFDFPDETIKIYAHKFILSVRSSVFSTMFYGAITEFTSNDSVVKIEDVSSTSFLEMLKFIYTDRVNITEDNLAEIMYVAHKYSIKHLERICCDYMRKALNKENCFNYLEEFYIYDDDFTEQCLKMIDATISESIEEGKWNELSEKPLLMILKRDSLDVNEFQLFKGVLNWAKMSCEKQGVEATIQNMREKFAVFELVRFPVMSLEEINECYEISGNNFFTAEELLSIFNYKSKKEINDFMRYSTIKRQVFGNLQTLTFKDCLHCPNRGVSKFNFNVDKVVKISKINCEIRNDCSVKIFRDSKILFEFDPSRLMESCDVNIILRPNIEYTIETEWRFEFIPIVCMYYFKSNNVFSFEPNNYFIITSIQYKVKDN